MLRPAHLPTAAHSWMLVAFATSGMLLFSWLARIPSIKDGLALSTVDLGVVLLVGSVGALATVIAAGPLMARWGTVPLFGAGTALMAVSYTHLTLPTSDLV